MKLYKANLVTLPGSDEKGTLVYEMKNGTILCAACANQDRELVVRMRRSAVGFMCVRCAGSVVETPVVEEVAPVVTPSGYILLPFVEDVPVDLYDCVICGGEYVGDHTGPVTFGKCPACFTAIVPVVIEDVEDDEEATRVHRQMKCHTCDRIEWFQGATGLDVTIKACESGWNDDEEGDICPVCAGIMTPEAWTTLHPMTEAPAKAAKKAKEPKAPRIPRNHKVSCNMTDELYEVLSSRSTETGKTLSTLLEEFATSVLLAR